MYGYMGKLLFVDLTTGQTRSEPLSEDDARNFLGGPGLGAKILYDNMPAHADVFGEDSMIGFVSGPLNNTKALFGGRYTVVSKSPVTGGWNDANSGGHFGERLRRSGYDGIFVRGLSEEPVYLLVDSGTVQILDASQLWGLKTREAEEALKKKHGKDVGVALIGPAGEHLSYLAAVMNDEHRAAARGGSGAVMGSKKLKAVVVKGSAQTPVADPKALSRIQCEILCAEAKALLTDKDIHDNDGIRDFFWHGTGGTFESSVTMCDTGFKNWTATNLVYPEDAAKEQSSHGLKGYRKGKFHCSRCHVGCSYFMDLDTGRWGKLETTRPEYETMGAFGPLMLNEDRMSVCVANDLCNQYGFDTISAGSTIAWAMECYENGLISKKELGGIELKWGSGDAIVEVLKLMGEGQGIGGILDKGSRKAAELLGRGEDFLVVASGIEQPQHDPRLIYPLGRTYMVDPTPGRHVKGSMDGMVTDAGFDLERSLQNTGREDAKAVVHTEIMNSCGACSFGYDQVDINNAFFRTINAITGFHYELDEEQERDERWRLGIRMFTMRQAFNLREGIRRRDCTLSKRMTTPSFHEALGHQALPFDQMVDSLYEYLGWTMEGVPTREALLALGGLGRVAQDLYGG